VERRVAARPGNPVAGHFLSESDYSEGDPAARGDATRAQEADLGLEDGAATLTVSAKGAAGERLDRFLAKALEGRVEGVSRSRIQRWIALGAVNCEQRAITASTRLAGYETLSVDPLPREADQAFEPDPIDLAIVDEDDHLLVIDKPAGLVVHPAAGHWRGTLLNGLLHHRPALAELPRAGIVHRLDKDTTGLMVVAKSERAIASLVGQLSARTMSRRYFAFVTGRAPAEVEIDVPIGRDPRSRIRMAALRTATAKPARTHVTRLAELRVEEALASLVECRLETGRTHQIRVHLKHIGHPLLGDALYGGPMIGIARQALHAWRLGLLDPLDGRSRRWVSVPPADMRSLAQYGELDFEALCNELDADC